MSNIIDINKYIKRKFISSEYEDEDVSYLFEEFFKIPLRLINVTDDNGNTIGYSAAPGSIEGGESIAEKAAISWDLCFRGVVFENASSILISYMDQYLEQMHMEELGIELTQPDEMK